MFKLFILNGLETKWYKHKEEKMLLFSNLALSTILRNNRHVSKQTIAVYKLPSRDVDNNVSGVGLDLCKS